MKVRAAHAFEHGLMLGELNVGVLHDLHPVAPRVPELHPSSGQQLDTCLLKPSSDLLFIVDHQAEMAIFIAMLGAVFRQIDKLVAKIEESDPGAASPQRKFEQPAIEGERFIDATDFQSDMIHPDEPRLVARYISVRHKCPPSRCPP